MKLPMIVEQITVPAVRCVICQQLHTQVSDTYVTFAGNVNIGADGGVVGNNFDSTGQLARVTICCRNHRCLTALLEPLGVFPR